MSATGQVYDLIGLGFGPANVAISGAIIDKWDANPATLQHVCFIEKHDRFRWHPGMLLPGTRMQISWLKDLATLRNPKSPITFLNYLHSQDRLIPFINKGADTPTRKEYADYLGWAAHYVQSRGISVSYGEDAIAVSRGPDGTVEVTSRDTKTGETKTRRAKNLVLSPGGAARMPAAISLILPHPKIIHSSIYTLSISSILTSITAKRNVSSRPIRIAVIGGGQSSAEVLLDLQNRLDKIPILGERRRHELELIISKGSLKPSDDSPFSNEVFDPSSTDAIFNLPTRRARERVLNEFKSTNYGVVNPRTIDRLYEALYEQRLDEARSGRTDVDQADVPSTPRITIRPYSSLIGAEILPPRGPPIAGNTFNDSDSEFDTVLLSVQDQLARTLTHSTYDAVVCGTGYDRTSWQKLFTNSDLGKFFIHGSNSGPIELVPSHSDEVVEVEDPSDMLNNHASSSPTSSLSGSSVSSPPTSPGSWSPLHGEAKSEKASKIYVSRAYRLLPVPSIGQDLPKIYVQGCTEMTHGLSDTLLSVVGVKAGEVVDDILKI